jgi:hypothetical protein
MVPAFPFPAEEKSTNQIAARNEEIFTGRIIRKKRNFIEFMVQEMIKISATLFF